MSPAEPSPLAEAQAVERPRVPCDREIRVRAEYESAWAEPAPPCPACGRVPNSGVDGCWCNEGGF
jgi:hypothetical protein